MIVLEGIDGAGKGGQIKLLEEFFKKNKIKYKIHKYPTKKAKIANAYLKGKEIGQEEILNSFLEDILSEQKKIAEELKKGFVVLCDRYIHSTLAYQGVKLGYQKLKKKFLSLNLIYPDIVILLDISPEESQKRKKAQKKLDLHENNLEFLKKVRENYIKMGKECFLCYKFEKIDASKEQEKVFAKILLEIEPLISKKMKEQ
jgi:dTMP kinase